ncbi:hypothetical protein DJ010_15055 [Nocardioides silvaticus]|uniref:WD40 repeat domain-containing protein n=1 Tax=Nocardioides silvaticus TaxID=2201891 RepID=A0A316TEJ2_9ACTN|nr:hypothetical protein [Nocardioides silvaticus]PWN01871.1 hypothetical protein DJ010_15055 [Nocardioides silvaticus]
MSGEQLKEELARVAEGAPDVHVPDDLFTRGRRATVRARVLVGAAAVACLAVVAAVTAPLLRVDESGVADNGDLGGVPDSIYAPDDGDLDLPMTDLADVGRAVATYPVTSEQRNQVVVVTLDGDYRLTALPGYDDMGASDVPPQLSPDGTLLAYPAEDDATSHLAIVDLRRGNLAKVDLADGLGALATSAQWSPNGEHLAWSGQVVTFRERSHRKYGRALAGIVDVGAMKSRPLPRAGRIAWDGLGVCDDGAALRYLWPRFLVTPAGDSSERERSWRRLVETHGYCTPPAVYSQADLTDDELVGWIPTDDEAHAVLLTEGDPVNYLLLTTDGAVETIGEVAPYFNRLSVATGLMTPERPTVPAGPDPWADPWIVDHWWIPLLALVSTGLLILIFVQARAVRR